MKYLDTTTGMRSNKILTDWRDLMMKWGVLEFATEAATELLHLTEALAKRWEGRQIMNNDLFMIYCESILRKLGDQSSPDSVRMVLVLNPT